MISVLIEVNVTVENIEDANDIAHDISEILDNNGVVNSVNVTDKISE